MARRGCADAEALTTSLCHQCTESISQKNVLNMASQIVSNICINAYAKFEIHFLSYTSSLCVYDMWQTVCGSRHFSGSRLKFPLLLTDTPHMDFYQILVQIFHVVKKYFQSETCNIDLTRTCPRYDRNLTKISQFLNANVHFSFGEGNMCTVILIPLKIIEKCKT